jgi:hypothetical protein
MFCSMCNKSDSQQLKPLDGSKKGTLDASAGCTCMRVHIHTLRSTFDGRMLLTHAALDFF